MAIAVDGSLRSTVGRITSNNKSYNPKNKTTKNK